MKRLDVIFSDRDGLPCLKNRFHHLGVASNFLVVASVLLFDFQIGNEAFTVADDQLVAALDAGGRADAFDRRHTAKSLQVLMSAFFNHSLTLMSTDG